jgi:fatty-acyl-CoA synthase
MTERVLQTVVDWLGAVVAAYGPRPALWHDGRVQTYAELWVASEAIARGLLEEERFTPGASVGLIGRNTPAYLGAYFGVQRAGGVVVPLNERLTVPEILEQLEIVDAVGVLAGDLPDEGAGLRDAGAAVWPIGTCAGQGSGRLPELEATAPACILLTSGSTGRPKGVVHSHATMLHATLQLMTALPFGPAERSIGFLPFYASIPEQVLPVLCAAGSLEILPGFDPERIARACRDGATSFDAVPTTMSRLLEAGDQDALRRLRWVSFASEPMPVALLERWWDTLPGVQTHQFYGMTECLTITHAGPAALRARPDSVGVPYPTSEVAVVDPQGRPVAPGERGEITCRTPARMLGYRGDAEATRAATTDRGAMRTGDLGTLTEDGALLLTGRLKDLIISGGYNIAPAEIEDVICRHPAVSSAVVVGIPDERWGETPVVVAVPLPGAEVAAGELLVFCRERLASFKRPSAAALVDDLPVTGIGKSAKGLVRQRILQGEIDLVRAG